MPAPKRELPRFEFRIFAPGRDAPAFDAAARALAAIGLPAGAENRRDVYCLQAGQSSGASLKLHGGALELKLLRAEQAPFELWDLAQRRRFPVAGSLLRAVLLAPAGIALDLPDGPVEAAEFVERVEAAPELRLVSVVKQRQRFDMITAIGEVTELRIDGEALRTLAVEGPDRAALGRILTRLGIAGARNVSFPRKLQEMLDKGAEVTVPP